MRPERFKPFFEKLSKEMTASLISRDLSSCEKCFEIEDNLPIFDVLDLLEKHECLRLENGQVITRDDTMRKPVKTLFYLLITEIEYRLYKVLKNRVESLEKLRESEFNELIRLFLENKELFEIQDIYSKRAELKEDLKAISSFRNVIMHAPRKIDLETRYDVVVKRKNQALKLMKMLGEIYFK